MKLPNSSISTMLGIVLTCSNLQVACRLLQVRVLPEADWAGHSLDRAITP